MSLNKETLLATPDTSLMTESIGTTEVNVRRGEEAVSQPRDSEEEALRTDPSTEPESNIWLLAQLMHLKTQNASLRAALECNTEIGRGRESSNPSRQDRPAVPHPGTRDRECPPSTRYGKYEAHPGYVLQEGVWYQEEEEPESTDRLIPRLPCQPTVHDPSNTTELVHSPSITPNRPAGEEVDSALALLQLAGARRGGTRQSATSKWGLEQGGFIKQGLVQNGAGRGYTEEGRRYGKSEYDDNFDWFTGPSGITSTHMKEAQPRQMTKTETTNLSSGK